MPRTDDILAISRSHADAGNYEQAERVLRQGLRQFPSDAGINQNLGAILLNVGRPQQALPFAQRVTQLQPRATLAWLLLAKCQVQLGKLDSAIESCKRVLSIDPGVADAHNTLGVVYHAQHQSSLALHHARRANELNPLDARFASTLAAALTDQAQPDEAYRIVLDAWAREPNHKHLAVGVVNASMYASGVSGTARLEMARRANQLMSAPARRHPLGAATSGTSAASEHALRLGLLSNDFRQHSCAYFLCPLLRQLLRADAPRCGGRALEVHAFNTLGTGDRVTNEFRAMFNERGAGQTPTHAFHDLGNLPPREMAIKVRDAKVDVLLDLCGLTAGSGIETLTYRPALVQGTYLGYPGTTGLEGVDFRIVDHWTDPASVRLPEDGSLHDPQLWHSERLIRMDRCFLCYDHLAGPLRPRAPRVPGSLVTFGSFNTPMKISLACIDAWAEVLRTVAFSRLVVKGASMAGEVAPRFLREQFEARGVDGARIETIARTATHEEHLALYDRIDIALDTFPYQGTTTTCEALMKGVPVVALLGPTHMSRVASSLLQAVGLDDLLCEDAASFARVAASLAGDEARLTVLHRTLRDRVVASPLCDARSHAASFVRAIESMLEASHAKGALA